MPLVIILVNLKYHSELSLLFVEVKNTGVIKSLNAIKNNNKKLSKAESINYLDNHLSSGILPKICNRGWGSIRFLVLLEDDNLSIIFLSTFGSSFFDSFLRLMIISYPVERP